MNKVIMVMICIIVIIGAIFIAMTIFESNTNKNSESEVIKIANEEIYDECTDEYEEMENIAMIEANSEKEIISPNCSFTIETHYSKCGHTKSEYLTLPESLVNKTKEELQEKYKEYEIKKFSNNEIILYQEKEQDCGEHYIVKDNKGKITIYIKLEDNTIEELEQTEISTDYLTESDKVNIQNGIEVNGRQNLNKLIEDFE